MFPSELWECKGCTWFLAGPSWPELTLVGDVTEVGLLFRFRNCSITVLVIHCCEKMIYCFRLKHLVLKMCWMPLPGQYVIPGLKGLFRKQRIFTWEITSPKDLDNFSKNICWHMCTAGRKCGVFCLACTWAWATASGELDRRCLWNELRTDGWEQELLSSKSLAPWSGATVTAHGAIVLRVGVTSEICETRILPLACKKVFTEVEDSVLVYWWNFRRRKLHLDPASFVWFPMDMINLVYFAVPEQAAVLDPCGNYILVAKC